MARVDVRIDRNEAAIRRLLDSPGGAVGRYLLRRGLRVESAAKRIATEEGLVDTGRYRSSIGPPRLGADGAGLFVEVGSEVPYAGILEEGSPPHEIRPRRKQALSWPGADHPVARVRHPGTRPYHVLSRALRETRR